MSTNLQSERVHHPPHYTATPIEPIAVIEAWQLGFCLGNVIKYIARADHKGTPEEDLQKALWYLNREVQRRAGKAPKQVAPCSA